MIARAPASSANLGPGFDVLAEQLTYGKFPPQFTWFEEWRRSLATATQDVMGGRKSPATGAYTASR